VQVSSPDGNATHRWVCTGYSIDGGKAVAGAIYTFANVQAAHTITFNWQEQYYLTVTSEYGSTGGSGWYNSGSTAKFTVTSPETDSQGNQVAFVSWNGTGIGAYTGSEKMGSVAMTNPISETTNWAPASILSSTSLYTVAESALILFALLLTLTLLLTWRRRRKRTKQKKRLTLKQNPKRNRSFFLILNKIQTKRN
jgi:hypothetical protein